MSPETNEADLIGEPVDDVPEIEPGEKCNARKSDGGTFCGYCGATAGRGTDHLGEGRCSHHGGNAGAPEGEANGSYEHGAYTDHILSDLSEREEEAFDALVATLQDGESDGPMGVLREQAVEAYLKYKRSNDARFLREYRQLLSEFNIVDSTDHQEVEHFGEVEGGSVNVQISHHRVTDDDVDVEEDTTDE